jgi:hypothetical protein
MLHSEENSDLPDFDIKAAGRHEFLRSTDENFPPFTDPYTIQFLTHCLDWPLTDTQLYDSLEEAEEIGWFEKVVDGDYRLAFGYPEWYGREIQEAFRIERSEELPKLPELDVQRIDVNKSDGELKNWVSSYGLASYLWNADEWDDYKGFIRVANFESPGWKHVLEQHGLEYSDMREIVPSGRPVHAWMAGQIAWEELLDEIRDNLVDKAGVDVKFTGD